jgi:microcystin-dependent protein
MSFALADLVQETSTAPGTGNVLLNGAATGRRSFVAGIGDGNGTYYVLSDGTQAEWGEGTVHDATPDFITRDVVLGNTAGTLVKLNFTTTTKVYGGIPVERLPWIDNSGQLHNIPTGSIATAMIADAAVTAAKLAAGLALPAGAMSPYAGTAAPVGWLLCDGSAVSRTTYAALFAVTGIANGAGDGSTTFNLPDARGRIIAGKDNMGGTPAGRLTTAGSGVDGATLGANGGAETQTLTVAQTPAHAHPVTVTDAKHHHVNGMPDSAGGSYYGNVGPHDATATPSDRDALTGGLVNGNSYQTSDDASGIGVSLSNTGGGLAHPNVQPTLVMNWIIKT